jgi:hypothetical protein
MGLLNQGFISFIETRFNAKALAALGASQFFFDHWSSHDPLLARNRATPEDRSSKGDRVLKAGGTHRVLIMNRI